MKRIVAMFMGTLLALCAAGCAKSADQNLQAQEGVIDVQAASGGTTLYGRVDSIVGNEITLSLGEPEKGGRGGTTSSSSLEQGDAQAQPNKQPQQNGKAQSGERTFEIKGERPARSGESAVVSGEMSSGEMPSGGMSLGEMPSENALGNGSASKRSGVTLIYSGETAKYLLPVGMAIGTGDFSDITQGMVISLVLNTEGTITAVNILSR